MPPAADQPVRHACVGQRDLAGAALVEQRVDQPLASGPAGSARRMGPAVDDLHVLLLEAPRRARPQYRGF
jgi:hypothetical protein